MKIKLSTTLVSTCLLFISNVYSQVARLPLEMDGPHAYIRVQTKEGSPLRFIFDTGATNATIDSSAAEKAEISKINRKLVSVAGSGGAKDYLMATDQTVKIGNVDIRGVDMVIGDFSALSKDIGSRPDGIIGYEIMKAYVTKLDFEHKELLLFDRSTLPDTTGYTGFPFEFSKNILIPRFPIAITLTNGETFSGKVMFDTGNAFSLIVSTPFSKFHNFDTKIGITTISTGRGLNARTTDQVATIKSMKFGDFDLGKMSIRLTVNPSAEAKDGYLGILGMEIIKRFHVILDYDHRKIFLKPNNAYNQPFKQDQMQNGIARESRLFLEQNKLKTGVKTSATGLQYKIIRRGNGALPTMSDRVSLHFTTRLVNGKKLWSTFDKNTPWTHHLDKTIAGVREAALMMPVGSKWEIYIPSELAFGEHGDDDVPAGAALIYELEVLKTEK